jgi:hypothetical protein
MIGRPIEVLLFAALAQALEPVAASPGCTNILPDKPGF